MRQQTDSNSIHSATDSHSNKKEQSDKKRLIKKDKLKSPEDDEKSTYRVKLSKQERAKMQKQKNKEAAQRSRDLHRQYVTKLQNELGQMRLQLQHSKKLCYRCQQSLDDEHENESLLYGLSIPHHQNSNPLEYSGTPSFVAEEMIDVQGENDQPESFLRVLEPHQDSNILKWMLLVCMVAIGVMIFGGYQNTDFKQRALMQTYSQSFTSPPYEQNIITPINSGSGSIDTYSTQWTPQYNGLVDLKSGINNSVCLDSLMKIESPVLKKSLRSIHEVTYSEHEQSILVCALKMPKVYSIKHNLNTPPLVNLFLLGSQIKEMITHSSPLLSLMDKNIQLNGIYRINAEIKGVNLVTQHNCLL